MQEYTILLHERAIAAGGQPAILKLPGPGLSAGRARTAALLVREYSGKCTPMLRFDPWEFAYFMIALVVGITVHEASHALSAYWLGDLTPKKDGRVTLNPLAHLDPLGTIMMIFTALTGVGIGWGRPVMVDPRYLRPNPNVGMALVAFAGPLSNIITAAVVVFLLEPARAYSPDLFQLVRIILIVNVSLAVFNMIPIPPLDGFSVVLGFLPERQAYTLRTYAQYGPLLLLAVIFFAPGVLGSIISPASSAILRVLLQLPRLI